MRPCGLGAAPETRRSEWAGGAPGGTLCRDAHAPALALRAICRKHL